MAVPSAEDLLKYPWGIQTCFQVYGTKRKLHHSEPETTTTEQSLAKRPCFVPIPLQTDNEYPHSRIEMSIHHNVHQAASNSDNRVPCQKFTATSYEDDDMPNCKQSRLSLPQESPMDNDSEMCESRNWQHSQECRDLHHQGLRDNEQSDMLRHQRLHEEAVVARRAVAEKLQNQLTFLQEISQSNDYWAVPQENQLKMADELEQAKIAMETDYVPNYHQYGCVPASAAVPMAGPNAHTTAGHVRCYCKPSWEGMLDPTSYI